MSLVLCATTVFAQTDPVADAQGFQKNHDYFSQEPFEHIDMYTGSLVLTFTDLVLPGNGGRDLRFTRTYNSKALNQGGSLWTFGLAGMPMLAYNYYIPGSNPPNTAIDIYTGDGALHKASTPVNPPTGNFPADVQVMGTEEFWRYDRLARTLLMPDGTIIQFDPTTSQLAGYQDPFHNTVTLTWDGTHLIVTQDLGADQTRTVVVTFDSTQTALPTLPTSMSYLGRTWQYSLGQVTPPVGSGWSFGSGSHGGFLVTTPHGGQIEYAFTLQTFPAFPYDGSGNTVTTTVVSDRYTYDRGGVPVGHWHYLYSFPDGYTGSQQTVLTAYKYQGGSEVLTSTTTFKNGFNTVCTTPTGNLLWNRVVQDENGQPVETEVRCYQWLPAWAANGGTAPELSQQTITRDGVPYMTTFCYGPWNGDCGDPDPTTFGNYHHPSHITESGDAGTRDTNLTYTNHVTLGGTPYILALKTQEEVTVNGDAHVRTWSYNDLGFRTTENAYGVATNFGDDGHGNIGIVTRNGHTTTLSYSWGIASQIQTPEYAISRGVNQDGTVASETRGGRTTTYTYDNLSRVVMTSPPASNPITTTYDPGGTWVKVSRGSSSTKTTLDGFGRPTLVQNSLQPPVQTRTAYDANGRTIYEGFPFTSNDVGTDLFYDALGRVTQRRHTGGASVTYSYGPGTVNILDENGHGTIEARQAFGNPDETRLIALNDGIAVWRYSYNALGKLTNVLAPDGITRSWVYNANNQLISETQPESGTTTYGPYDAAGNLTHKRDGNNTPFDYTYDGNERLSSITANSTGATQITYEPGLDVVRRKLTADNVLTAFGYDAAGRLNARTDVIDGRSYTRLFQYDGNDNLSQLTYASGRQVQYQFDNENRITRVKDLTANLDIASNFQYHPSGAVASFTSGNGIVNTITYDPNRYWVRSITAGPLALSYDTYDDAGNVKAINDSRPGMNQSFAYDTLDRLTTANGPWGSATYGYDDHGNRLGGGAIYDPNTLRLLQANGRTFAYDNNGNLKTSNNDAFSYSPDNHLETSIVGGVTTTYVYDADGWREKMTTPGTTSYFLRGANGELLTESKNPGGASPSMRDYIYAGTKLLSVVTVSGIAQ